MSTDSINSFVRGTPNVDVWGGLDRRNALEDSEALIDLIDNPGVFQLLVDLTGPYI